MLWLTADLHLGDEAVIKHDKRPFLTRDDYKSLDSFASKEAVRLMDSDILESINRYVLSDDILFIIGDFCKCYHNDQQTFTTTANYLARINCKRCIIVWGNHDKPKVQAPLFYSSSHDYRKNEYITTLGKTVYIHFYHFPCLSWDRSHYGSYHFYGHEHGTAEKRFDALLPDRFSMDVGIDHAYQLFREYRPFTLHEAVEHCDRRFAKWAK